jgi:cytochrome c biogenesis protein CcdA
MATRTTNALRLSRGLILGRALARLWHGCLGAVALGLIGMVLVGQGGLAIVLVVTLYLLEKACTRWLTRRMRWF